MNQKTILIFLFAIIFTSCNQKSDFLGLRIQNKSTAETLQIQIEKDSISLSPEEIKICNYDEDADYTVPENVSIQTSYYYESGNYYKWLILTEKYIVFYNSLAESVSFTFLDEEYTLAAHEEKKLNYTKYQAPKALSCPNSSYTPEYEVQKNNAIYYVRLY